MSRTDLESDTTSIALPAISAVSIISVVGDLDDSAAARLLHSCEARLHLVERRRRRRHRGPIPRQAVTKGTAGKFFTPEPSPNMHGGRRAEHSRLGSLAACCPIRR
jgi:hypothetical protein